MVESTPRPAGLRHASHRFRVRRLCAKVLILRRPTDGGDPGLVEAQRTASPSELVDCDKLRKALLPTLMFAVGYLWVTSLSAGSLIRLNATSLKMPFLPLDVAPATFQWTVPLLVVVLHVLVQIALAFSEPRPSGPLCRIPMVVLAVLPAPLVLAHCGWCEASVLSVVSALFSAFPICMLRRKLRALALTPPSGAPDRVGWQPGVLGLIAFVAVAGPVGLIGWRYRHPTSIDAPGVVLRHAHLTAINLTGADLAGADLSRADLSGTTASQVDFSHANLTEANLRDSRLVQAELYRANLESADLSDARWRQTGLAGAVFRNATLTDRTELGSHRLAGVDFSELNAQGARFTGADLAKTHFANGELAQADFAGTRLVGADLTRANLREANFADANLARARLVEAELGDADFSRANLVGADLTRARLTGATFHSAAMQELVLDSAQFGHTDFTCTKLGSSKFSRTDLTGSTFDHANLAAAKMQGARLRGVTFQGATLVLADLTGADLVGASLEIADLSEAILRDTDLQGVSLKQARLKNVSLAGARHLTEEMLNEACGTPRDLPAHLHGLELPPCPADWGSEPSPCVPSRAPAPGPVPSPPVNR